jgi:hypothetical protein
MMEKPLNRVRIVNLLHGVAWPERLVRLVSTISFVVTMALAQFGI